MNKIATVAFVFASVSITANAAALERQTARKGGYCISNSFMGSDSLFSCDHIGKVTISQIYDKGWRVVQKEDVQGTAAVAELFIEEQR